MRGEFVDVGNHRLYYYAAGTRGQGEPIILIHGFPTSGHLWSNLVSLLPSGHRVVVPDLLGFGRSECVEPADLSLQGHADRIVGLMDTLQIQRACLVGHHLGANVSAIVAARAATRVSHLALLHPLGGDVTWTGTFAVMRAFLPVMKVTPARLVRRPVRAELTRWFSDPQRSLPSVDQYVGACVKPHGWKQLLRQLSAVDSTEMMRCTAMLSSIQCPVAIASSDADPAVPHVALDRVREALPNATLDIIKHVRHFSPEESPERVAGLVAHLLRS